ncbi:MAG: SHOCT domain-containing protein [Calditrichaeota bacterium]|nr:SHOCT domain-containing protein [Calditrichota bacterium]
MTHEFCGMNWGWGGMVFQALFWLALLGIIFWSLRNFLGQNRTSMVGPANGSSAIDILKARYASGEIDKQEFEERLRNLKN